MKRSLFTLSFMLILLACSLIQLGEISIVKASPDIHQGDLVITGNDVYVIENGRFDINGSIIVEDNATLRLVDAYLNFNQTEPLQYNITLRNPLDGNPRLQAHNSTITSFASTQIWLWDNGTATINNSTIDSFIYARDNSTVTISSRSNVHGLRADDFSGTNIYNSTVSAIDNYHSPEVQAWNSEINWLEIAPQSVGCIISDLVPSHVDYWSFTSNCSVNVFLGGSTPDVTLTNTSVDNWRFGFYGSSNASILDSDIWDVICDEESNVFLKSTICSSVYALINGVFLINDSTVNRVWAYHFSSIWLTNSTWIFELNVYDSAQAHTGWYLDVYVVDSLYNAVPSANVTAVSPKATQSESKLTDLAGWARLTLTEKVTNVTGEYPVGNYTVEATYDTHSASTSINMTDNKQTTLKLEDFVIPEFSSICILSLLMIITPLIVIVYRRKHPVLLE